MSDSSSINIKIDGLPTGMYNISFTIEQAIQATAPIQILGSDDDYIVTQKATSAILGSSSEDHPQAAPSGNDGHSGPIGPTGQNGPANNPTQPGNIL